MSYLQFNAPPLPYYMAGGEDTYQLGDKHPSRRNVNVFDLLVVTHGRLFMSEGVNRWVVEPGQALVLRPDGHHFSTAPCREQTHFYWLHFQTTGEWYELTDQSHQNSPLLPIHSGPTEISNGAALSDETGTVTPYGRLSAFLMKLFVLRIARHCDLAHTSFTLKNLAALIELEHHPEPSARWKQQILFQEIIQDLSTEQAPSKETTAIRLAQQAARFLRENYRSEISYASLRQHLDFHPTYIARCMRRVFDCAPQEYLVRYRIEQAKLLLMNTEMAIQEVSHEVGFNHLSYFSRSFVKIEGVTPRMYRKRYRT